MCCNPVLRHSFVIFYAVGLKWLKCMMGDVGELNVSDDNFWCYRRTWSIHTHDLISFGGCLWFAVVVYVLGWILWWDICIICCWKCKLFHFIRLTGWWAVCHSNLKHFAAHQSLWFCHHAFRIKKEEERKRTPVQCTGMNASPLSEC